MDIRFIEKYYSFIREKYYLLEKNVGSTKRERLFRSTKEILFGKQLVLLNVLSYCVRVKPGQSFPQLLVRKQKGSMARHDYKRGQRTPRIGTKEE